MTTARTITQRATRQVKWIVLSEIVRRSITPIVTVILARLLTPEAFGLVSTAAICVAFAQMFWDAGLSKAIIQTDVSPEEAANVVFWSNVVLGAIIYILLYAAAPAIAAFFKSHMVTTVLRVIGLQIIVVSLSSVQRALCVRDLRFKKLLGIQLATALVPGFVSIPMALAGQGVWALVAGTMSGQACATIALWKFSDWKPSFSFDWKMAARLFSFAVWIQAESFLLWLAVYGDSIIVGKTMGMGDLGIYRTGWMMVSILFGIVLNPFLQLILPTFSRLQADKAVMVRTFHKATKLAMAVTVPMGVGLWFCGQDAASVFFGTKWVGLGFVLQILGFAQAMSWLTGINADVFRAMGKPKVNTMVMFAQLVVYLPVYFVASQHGLRVFVICRALLSCLGLLGNVYICHRMLNITILYIIHIGKSLFAAAALMALSLYALAIFSQVGSFASFPLLYLLVKIAVGATIFIVSLYLIDRRFVSDTMALINRSIN